MTTTTTADAIQQLNEGQRVYDAAKQSGEVLGSVGWSSNLIVFLTLAVLTFLVVIVIASTILMWRQRSTADHMLRIFGIILIAGLSSILLIVGYSSAQLTPIIGLFGAIAGYLLGKDSGEKRTNASDHLPPR